MKTSKLTLTTEYCGPLPAEYYKDDDGVLYNTIDLRVNNVQINCMLCCTRKSSWHDSRFPGHSYAKYNNVEGYKVKDGFLYHLDN